MDHPFNGSPFLGFSTKKQAQGSSMSFTEEQIAFRDSIRKMVAKHVAPIAAEIDETDRFPDRAREAVRRDGADAALGARAIWRPERQSDHDVHRARGDLEGLAGLRLDRRPQHHVHHAAAALRLRGAAPEIPADHRQRRRRHRDRDLRAAGRLRRHRDQHPRQEGRRQLRHQRPQAMVQLRRRGRLHRA